MSPSIRTMVCTLTCCSCSVGSALTHAQTTWYVKNDASGTDNGTSWTSCDADADGVPDECACFGDLDFNGLVNAADLAQLLGLWGPAPGHPGDYDANGLINAVDLAHLLGQWGPCQ